MTFFNSEFRTHFSGAIPKFEVLPFIPSSFKKAEKFDLTPLCLLKAIVLVCENVRDDIKSPVKSIIFFIVMEE